MDRKSEKMAKNRLIWYKELESCIDNPICFRGSFVPEMQDRIQVDVRRYS